MGRSCLVNRLLAAAALGYVGAGPLNSTVLSWLVAVIAVIATYLWTARLAHGGSACAVPNDHGSGTHSTEIDPAPISLQRIDHQQEQRT